MSWVTEISHVEQNKFFVDEQRFGPYKFWHHKHIFTKLDNGCKITDIIDYGLPFGLVGEFFHPIFIKPKLEEIFIYRNKRIKDLFGSL
jgi:ligand-binding SRPBCC domain-containing protein